MLYEDCEWIMQCGMLFDNNEAHCPFDAWHHTCVQYLLVHKRFYFLSLCQITVYRFPVGLQ